MAPGQGPVIVRRPMAKLLLPLLALSAVLPAQQQLFVGTNRGEIRVFDLKSGKLEAAFGLKGPAPLQFVAFHPRKPLLYAAVQRGVQSYRIGDQALEPLHFVTTGLRGTHLDLAPNARWLLVASYGGGALQGLPVDAAGKPGKPSFELKSPEAACKKAHQVRFAADGRHAYAPCLGDDVVQVLAIGEKGPSPSSTARLEAGSGPRHLAFHPSGRHLYVVNELSSSIYTFAIDAKTGALSRQQALSALPEGREEGSRSSDIQVSPDGRFVYAVHREPLDQVVTLAVQKDGSLKVRGRSPTGGKHSRSFAVAADGQRIIFAHSRSKDVIVREIDPETGLVGNQTQRIELPAAVVFAGFRPKP